MWKQKVFYPVDTYDAGIRSKLFNRLVEEDDQFGSNKTSEITTDSQYDSNAEKDFIFNDLDKQILNFYNPKMIMNPFFFN